MEWVVMLPTLYIRTINVHKLKKQIHWYVDCINRCDNWACPAPQMQHSSHFIQYKRHTSHNREHKSMHNAIHTPTTSAGVINRLNPSLSASASSSSARFVNSCCSSTVAFWQVFASTSHNRCASSSESWWIARVRRWRTNEGTSNR